MRWRRPRLRMSGGCRGGRSGGLHGVPVGLKDIIDTADMPTENGSVLHAGRTPSRDAAVVERLRAAGAVIMGKTVTTEFATRTRRQDAEPAQPGAYARAARRAGRRRRWPRAWCRSRSGARPAGPRSGPGPTAASTPSSRPTAWCRGTACSSSRAASTTSGSSRGRSRIWRCCSRRSRATTSAIPTRTRADAGPTGRWRWRSRRSSRASGSSGPGGGVASPRTRRRRSASWSSIWAGAWRSSS